MATKEPVNFNKKTFSGIKADLLRFLNEQYPEVQSDFTDSNIGSMLIDVNAGVGNNLSINTDRTFQETQIDFAQQRRSILQHAKNHAFNIPGKRASVTLVDLVIEVPAKGDTFDKDYLPVLAPGVQVNGNGKIFETTDTVDFASPIGTNGNNNRSFIPNFDGSGIIQNYTVTKREVVFNGKTTIYQRVVRDEDIVPFFSVVLPEDDVVSVDKVALLLGTNFSSEPPDSEFDDLDNKFHEVPWLIEQNVFIEDPSIGLNTGNTSGVKTGKWIEVSKKFIKEFTPNGLCKLTFGGGDGTLDLFRDGFAKAGVTGITSLQIFFNNTATGEKLKADHTLFIKYRTGGGQASNIGPNLLTQLGSFDMTVNGPVPTINTQVNRSLRANNPIASFGGRERLNVEEIRHLTKFNQGSQERGVVIDDYTFLVNKIPGKFGAPFRVNSFKENNKIVVNILGLDSAGKLDNVSTSLLKENIGEYLHNLRAINDYVEIRDGKIFNLSFTFELFIDNANENHIANNVIRAVVDFFNVTTRQMNEDIFLAPLQNTINDVAGVINIISMKVFNKVGNGYSLNEIEQKYSNETTKQIEIINSTVYSTPTSMFEIKFPEKDITLILKKAIDLF